MYERDWDEYSRHWDQEYGNDYPVLGYEWAGPEFAKEFVDTWLRPFVRPTDVLLEIGPGGGRFTEILLPLCSTLHVADVSGEMLARVRARFPGATTIHYHKLDGRSLGDVPAVDAVLSFDVFVHLEPEDIFMYLTEIRARLRPGGVGVIHFSNILTERGWQRFAAHYALSVGGRRECMKFSWMTVEVMRKFMAVLGFEVLSLGDLSRDALVVFRQRADETGRPGSAPRREGLAAR